uniref:DNA topoisomerase n=1 Tax=Rhodosorus marinus TaxID=101924 RepID=A0A7S3A2B7_9RHOD|mmetsp:Transcript_40780/g.161586  ORF Transcript_40780/g.161586 Transcript_40780/m.161586 type:complete len:1027 (+) Transcript_40780:232-3312(+)
MDCVDYADAGLGFGYNGFWFLGRRVGRTQAAVGGANLLLDRYRGSRTVNGRNLFTVPYAAAKGPEFSKEKEDRRKALVVVESPAKAKTIQKFLSEEEFQVESCIGHVRDLPDSAKRIPAKYKGLSWARLGVDVDNGFEPLYIIVNGKQPVITTLRRILADCSRLILATDEDREGEAIAWHLLEVLKPKVPVARAVFHEITKDAIVSSFSNVRDLNLSLVKSQETRRILDRLAGFTMSPLLWKKISPGLSAGRVQSVALDFIVQRENRRLRFIRASYWDAKLDLQIGGEREIPGVLSEVRGKKLASGTDFDEEGKLVSDKLVWIKEEDELSEVLNGMDEVVVKSVERRKLTRQPPAPFITSTMQQAASSRLSLPAGAIMRTAQKLYEAGYITYMRTDNPEMSNQAVAATRDAVTAQFGEEYLASGTSKQKRMKPKNAQEAHEAIRPAGNIFMKPGDLPLEGSELKLYSLIYERTLASQMAPAQYETMGITFSDPDQTIVVKSSASRILFAGFRAAYSQDEEERRDGTDRVLPDVNVGDKAVISGKSNCKHETSPAPRYSDASLVKEMEQSGVGRPSTYAAIIDTLENRGYVCRVSSRYLAPSVTAFAVDSLLSNYFPDYVDADFTARMETELDRIANGDGNAKEYLTRYYLDDDTGLRNVVETQGENIDKSVKEIKLPGLKDANISVMVGPYGPYLVENEKGDRVSIPPNMLPEQLNSVKTVKAIVKTGEEPQIGVDPETNLPVLCKLGPYGPYVQLGADDGSKAKLKRASLPSGMSVSEVDLQLALKLLSLPRALGDHPETRTPVVASTGRFGPYLSYEGEFVSLPKDEDVYSIELDRALEILQQKAQRRKRRISSWTIEDHEVEVWSGRYGPYVKFGSANVKLSKELAERPEDITEADLKAFLKDKLEALEEKTTKKKGTTSKSSGSRAAKSQKKKSSSSADGEPADDSSKAKDKAAKKTRTIRARRNPTSKKVDDGSSNGTNSSNKESDGIESSEDALLDSFTYKVAVAEAREDEGTLEAKVAE